MALIIRPNQSPVSTVSTEVVQVNSFNQYAKHATKTDKFVHLSQQETTTVLLDHGFKPVSFKTARARLADRANHQTSIARFRSQNEASISGLWMDLVLKMPHLYGAYQGFVGTFRQVCTNGMTVGEKFVVGRVAHTGDALNDLNRMIPHLVAQYDQLVDHIKLMQARNVTPLEIAELTRRVAHIRLGSAQNETTKVINVQYRDLLKIRRSEDAGTDLFSVLNVLQENVMRYGVRYQTETSAKVDALGSIASPKVIRNMTARPITQSRQGEIETSRSIDLNAQIWDAAFDLLAA